MSGWATGVGRTGQTVQTGGRPRRSSRSITTATCCGGPG